MSITNFDQLLEAGVHFGHLKRKWNPAMAPYIFMERNGIHIIDLYKTVAKIDEAAAALKSIAKSGKKILFVATKKQAKQVVADKASAVNMPYVIERWPGGMLTNFPTIRKAVKKMSTIDKMEKDGTFDNLSKREKLQISRQQYCRFESSAFRFVRCRCFERTYCRARGQSFRYSRICYGRYQLESERCRFRYSG